MHVFFHAIKEEKERKNVQKPVPENVFLAFVTVVITVHAYVFYSLYVVNGNLIMSLTGENSVIRAINAQGGVYMFGRMLPIC